MIKHVVMWKVRGDTREQRRLAALGLKQRFEHLRGRIPGLLDIEVGINLSEVAYACDAVLLCTFGSQADLDAYASHPEHLRVREELGDVRIARHQVDFETSKLATPGGLI